MSVYIQAAASKNLLIMFVGGKDQWEHSRRRLRSSHFAPLQVDAGVVLAWIQFLILQEQPGYMDVQLDDALKMRAAMEALPDQFLDEAHIGDDDVTVMLEQLSASDVAQVRPLSNYDDTSSKRLPSVDGDVAVPDSDYVDVILEHVYLQSHSSIHKLTATGSGTAIILNKLAMLVGDPDGTCVVV